MRSSTKLTPKQEKFIREYLIDYNGKQAAIRAGYSARSAAGIAHENLTEKPLVMTAIQANVMSQEEALLRISDIARGDLADFLDNSGQPDLSGAAGKTKIIRRIRVKSTTTVEGDVSQDFEIELYSALDALEKIGRFHKMFTDRTEHSGPDGGPIEIVKVNWDTLPDDTN